MSTRRILLMYISEYSGHHRASLAIESALRELSDDIEIRNVNSFNYTNPILERIVNKTYMGIIKRRPEFWGYLYDNPRIVKKTQRLREAIHKYNSVKMKNLLDTFMPHAVICTQAFPCGIVADHKKTFGSEVLLSGVLTDYAPHSYWLYENVDIYFVPSDDTGDRLVANGIKKERVITTGIPVDPKFKKIIDKEKACDKFGISQDVPVVLFMGGSQGLGPIREMIRILDASNATFQMVVVAGNNKKLFSYLTRARKKHKKRITVLGYIEDIDEIMAISSLIITKPGGITISESLTKALPIIIVKPIPGHEELNTSYLVKSKVAIKVDNLGDLNPIITELFSHPESLESMTDRVKLFARPNSSSDIARAVLERIM